MSTVLLMDVGNSAVKWSVGGPEGLGPVQTLAYEPDALDLDEALSGLMPMAKQVGGALGCSVAQPAVARIIEKRLGRAVTWLPAQRAFVGADWVLRNGYRDPTQLGADRWYALVGACSLYPRQALMVVQAGTATTIDAVTAAGDFVGGDILPGWTLMGTSLTQRTAQLQWQDAPVHDFADNTASAMASGIADAQLGAIERLRRRFVARYAWPGDAQLVLTGGAAARLLSAMEATERSQVQVHEHLVLQGLCLFAKGELGS